MSRKNLFQHLTPESVEQVPITPLVSKSKALGAVTQSLDGLKDRSRRADEIERKLAQGQSVIDLDPKAIDPSFVQDRMDGDIDGLLASIREQGQQVPILVRPHPERSGRYQVAFGHRRLRAVTELGMPVKAVVRDLSDEQLVIAQGQENSERRDLSFIEKARFAARLQDRFGREIVISSMSIDKGNLSKMLAIVAALPPELIDAIGPAFGIGQPFWQQMVELFREASDPDELIAYARSKEAQAYPSADRFKHILQTKTKIRTPRATNVVKSADGAPFASVRESKTKVDISIGKSGASDFAAFLITKLPALFEEHSAAKKLETGD
jgi:ParB family chromosome partitioning protein